ncbi:hypothetical protein DFQ26_005368, partial [Actinomortierella ambigua]
MGAYSSDRTAAATASGPSFLTLYSSMAFTGLAAVGLYMLLTGSGEQFNVGEFILSISPYQWSLLGIGLCVGLSVGGAA